MISLSHVIDETNLCSKTYKSLKLIQAKMINSNIAEAVCISFSK